MSNNNGPLCGLSKAQIEKKLSEDIKKFKSKVTVCPAEPTPSRLPAPDPRHKTIVELYGKWEGGLDYVSANIEV